MHRARLSVPHYLPAILRDFRDDFTKGLAPFRIYAAVLIKPIAELRKNCRHQFSRKRRIDENNVKFACKGIDCLDGILCKDLTLPSCK